MRSVLLLSLIGQCVGAFTFATIGDWGGANLGGYQKTDEVAVAKQMGETAQSLGVQLVINTGDNFYYCGVKTISDEQFKIDFEDVFTAKSLSVPWYGVLGNHDYAFDPASQLKYKSPNNDRWQMPARYFTKRQLLGGSQYATFVFLDTNPCYSKYRANDPKGWDPCSGEFGDECKENDGVCHFHDNILTQDCGAQYAWLKETLGNISKDDWIIAVGHHPANEIDVNDMTGLLMAKPIHLYLNGHTHALSHYRMDGNKNIDFVLSGAGAMVKTADQDMSLRVCSEGHSSDEVWYKKAAGFTVHTFSEDFATLTTKFIDSDGSEIYSLTTAKNGSPQPSPAPGPSPSPGPAPPSPPSPPSSSGTCAEYGCGRYSSKHDCQCNSSCKEHQDCCSDYDSSCGGSFEVTV